MGKSIIDIGALGEGAEGDLAPKSIQSGRSFETPPSKIDRNFWAKFDFFKIPTPKNCNFAYFEYQKIYDPSRIWALVL
jgi:hypothetical protein